MRSASAAAAVAPQVRSVAAAGLAASRGVGPWPFRRAWSVLAAALAVRRWARLAVKLDTDTSSRVVAVTVRPRPEVTATVWVVPVVGPGLPPVPLVLAR